MTKEELIALAQTGAPAGCVVDDARVVNGKLYVHGVYKAEP